MATVLGIGNALLDLLCNVPDEVLTELELPKGSMQLINEKQNQTILKVVSKYPKIVVSGGSASNCIHSVAHLGVKCTLQGKIGKDANGKAFEADCVNSGITPNLVLTDMATGCANAFITPDGERTFGTFLGAASTLCANDINEQVMKGVKVLHTEGYLMNDHDMFRKMMKVAKEQGLEISLDVGSFNVINSMKDFFDEIIRDYVDILFCNEEEAQALTGVEDPYESLDMLSQIVKLPIVKLGGKGSIVKMNGKTVKIEPFKVKKVVDTTGAGDSYAGTFLAGYIRGASYDKCCKAASLVSSKVIQKMGAKLTDEQWDQIRPEVEEIFA
ncbi:ribokinase, putative [Entamoeba invadens IP1]|uniref:ribokinase, putative n=1 Tax=Entamoeba invadens IP1 TaxID=370355 RepID=UPI0002C3D7C0|nr:ribokinase, putative [Entamoeba invadens IP1]ELP94050.1 ribokinase, putative [Entamoeba invadens IP1]|eukprot:XP_004260821.1 ribokinase, putative [Entamoeba invadens IP1]